MKQQNIESIKRACVAANPEIMELKFGCEVRKVTSRNQPLAFQCPIETYADNEILIFEYDSLRFQSQGGDDNSVTYLKKDYKILGRPIRLADILNALSAHVPNGMNGKSIMVGEYGAFYEEMRDYNRRCAATWNLLKDDLRLQDEPTLSFIAGLLSE